MFNRKSILAILVGALSMLALCAPVAMATNKPKPMPMTGSAAAGSVPDIGLKCSHSGEMVSMNINRKKIVLVTLIHYEGKTLDTKTAVGINRIYYPNPGNLSRFQVHTLENDYIHPRKCWTIIDSRWARPVASSNPLKQHTLCAELDQHFVGMDNPVEPRLNRPGAPNCPIPKLRGGFWTYVFYIKNNPDMTPGMYGP